MFVHSKMKILIYFPSVLFQTWMTFFPCKRYHKRNIFCVCVVFVCTIEVSYNKRSVTKILHNIFCVQKKEMDIGLKYHEGK